MVYDPNRLDQGGREAAYWQVRAAGVMSLVMLASNFLPLGPHVEGFVGFYVGIWFVLFALYRKFDDYFMGLVHEGALWALCVLGLWLGVQGLLSICEGFYGIGYSAGGAELSADDRTFALPAQFNSAWLIGSAVACAFHAGFLYKQFRGGGNA
ncbi:hypothetical protein [Aurantiacibacter luteus]|uniref:Uncharacterized protein n=1 Tax=Aurantiacibacter luteus TaxID=1581420 RepID=A0A0G9MXP2_9SPHN|nr:hypothetical protein [Aurantiacibacter luteus]KLE35506.1 hypothetical protein AAW00_03515 [Aurantiacibacter luteus]